MRLSLIHIIEGFGVRTGVDWASVSKSDVDYKAIVRDKDIYFSPIDSPEDIVRIEEALQITDLAKHVFSDRHQLPTFTGTIYYGFKATFADQYRDQSFNKILAPFDRLSELYFGLSQTTIGDALTVARRTADPVKYGGSGEPNAELAQALIDASGAASQMYDFLNIKKPYKANCPISHVKALIQDRMGQYVKVVAYELADRLKHPQNQQDKQVLSKFLELAVQQFIKIPNIANYDYVVYPQSSGSFNILLAKSIADQTGGMALQVNKLPRERVKVDRDQLMQRGKQEIEGHRALTGPDAGKIRYEPRTGTQFYDDPDKFVEDWTETEHRKLEGLTQRGPQDQPMKAKDVPKDKRRYLKMFGQEGTEEAAGFEVLIVDDNIVGGSTVELVHEILSKLQPPPTRIDSYVPLYLPY